LSVFSDGFALDTSQPATTKTEEIDLQSMQWGGLEQRLSDRIGTSEYSLFAPDERGWHTCVALPVRINFNQNYQFFSITAVQSQCNVMIVFGGFRYKINAVPHPFRSHPLPLDSDMECLNDIRVYDLLNQSWHGVQKPEDDSQPADDATLGEVHFNLESLCTI